MQIMPYNGLWSFSAMVQAIDPTGLELLKLVPSACMAVVAISVMIIMRKDAREESKESRAAFLEASKEARAGFLSALDKFGEKLDRNTDALLELIKKRGG